MFWVQIVRDIQFLTTAGQAGMYNHDDDSMTDLHNKTDATVCTKKAALPGQPSCTDLKAYVVTFLHVLLLSYNQAAAYLQKIGYPSQLHWV